MRQAAEFAVVYDVTNDRERARVDKLMKGYGFRVQKSVFECRLTRSERRGMIAAIQKLALKTGSVKIYRVYGGAESVVLGQPMLDKDGDYAYAI